MLSAECTAEAKMSSQRMKLEILPDIGSDHNLLKINFKVKLRVKTEKKYNEERKIVNIFKIQSGNKNML